jgi:mannose-6-phosphate isomerase-like protein (cupin superfamily)
MTTPVEPIDVAAAFARFTERWQPHTIARINDYDIRIAKVAGEFAWHTHPETDEFFLVVDGTLTIQLRDGDVTLAPGQLYVVPKGVEHCPKADAECQILMVEPTATVNTGDLPPNELTAAPIVS